jgi:hypothetical protein
MEISYSIDPAARLVRYAVRGRPTLDRTREFLLDVASAPEFEQGYGFLADCRGMTDDPTTAYVRAFAREIRTRAPVLGPCRWAVLCSAPAVFAAVRRCILLTHGSGIEFAPFASVAEAMAWVLAGTDGPDSGFVAARAS